jgi:hypothetical protein
MALYDRLPECSVRKLRKLNIRAPQKEYSLSVLRQVAVCEASARAMPYRGARLHLPEYMVAAVDGLFGRVLRAEKHPRYVSPPMRPLDFYLLSDGRAN